MIRFDLYLEKEALKRLERISVKEKVSIAKLIREGVKRILEEREHE